jgi:hypothetical protein
VQLPPLVEIKHPVVQSLFLKSDQDLVTLFQRHPDSGQYFVAIFCRYGQVLYTLISTSTRSPLQADYLFAQTWDCIYNEMRSLDLRGGNPKLSLQSWLINVAAMMINRIELPPVEEIQYSLTDTPPIFWCYLNQALRQLPGNLRLVLLLSQTFHWSNTRVAAYLQAEGEQVSANDVQNILVKAYAALEASLPEDIRDIYFAHTSLAA